MPGRPGDGLTRPGADDDGHVHQIDARTKRLLTRTGECGRAQARHQAEREDGHRRQQPRHGSAQHQGEPP